MRMIIRSILIFNIHHEPGFPYEKRCFPYEKPELSHGFPNEKWQVEPGGHPTFRRVLGAAHQQYGDLAVGVL